MEIRDVVLGVPSGHDIFHEAYAVPPSLSQLMIAVNVATSSSNSICCRAAIAFFMYILDLQYLCCRNHGGQRSPERPARPLATRHAAIALLCTHRDTAVSQTHTAAARRRRRRWWCDAHTILSLQRIQSILKKQYSLCLVSH